MWLKIYPSTVINLAQAVAIQSIPHFYGDNYRCEMVLIRYDAKDYRDVEEKDSDINIFCFKSAKEANYVVELLYRLMAEGRNVCDIEEIKEAVKKKFKE